jgi:hypothetical protein
VNAVQPRLPEFDAQTLRQQRKRVRAVSKGQYAHLRDTGKLSKRTADVLRSIAAMFNRTQVWPTRGELAAYMHGRGDIARPDPSLIAPRLTELSRGVMDRVTRVYQGGGVIEVLPKRPCAIAQTPAHPWRVTEAGAKYRVGA